MRTQLSIVIISVVATMCVLAATPERIATGAQPEPPRQYRARWWRDQGVVIAGSWESLAYRVRAGGDFQETMAGFQREQSEETARRLKEMGFNLILIPLYKGFGLQNAGERETMEAAKRFAGICRRLELRVGVYIFSGTIGYESVLAEDADAREWFIRDHKGEYTYYSHRYYRRWANRSHPGIRGQMRELVRFAVEEVKADLIHLDNYMVGPGYESYSIQQFRAFLKQKYGSAALVRRFGFSVVDYVEPPPPPPEPDRHNADPLYQDWLDYRCETIADTYRELAEYARSLNPEIVMALNPHGYTGAINGGAVDHPRLIHWGSAFWDEGYPSRLEKGRVISRFRSHKLGRQFDNMVFQYTSSRVSMAESMANNLQSVGTPVWFENGRIRPMVPPTPTQHVSETLREYIRFFRHNQRFFRDAEEVADVGVLNTFANSAYGPSVTRQRLAGFEQALYQGKIPFTLVPGRYPGELNRFRVLVVADLALIPDSLVNAIVAYVRKGGGLVITGQAGQFDENHRPRTASPWAGFFSESLTDRVVRAHAGSGRAIYVPQVALPEGAEIGVLPSNSHELLDAVRWAAVHPFRVEVKAPQTVTMSLYRQPEGHQLLHLVNYDDTRPVSNVRVTLQVPSTDRPPQIVLLSPDLGEAREIPSSKVGDRLTFTVPRLEVYSLIVIER